MSDLVTIFIRPTKVFTRVRQQGIWVAAFLAVVILATLPTVFVISTAGIELLTLQSYQHDPKLAERIGGDKGIERAISSSNDRWTKALVVSRVSGTVAASLILLAAAFTLAVSIFGQRPKFFVMLGAVSAAVFPFALLGAVLSAVFLLSGADQSSMDLENMPALNLGRMLDRTTSNPAIFSMATQMDLLLGGEMLLMAFGLTKVSSLTFIQGLAICGSIWAVVVLWKAAWMVYM